MQSPPRSSKSSMTIQSSPSKFEDISGILTEGDDLHETATSRSKSSRKNLITVASSSATVPPRLLSSRPGLQTTSIKPLPKTLSKKNSTARTRPAKLYPEPLSNRKGTKTSAAKNSHLPNSFRTKPNMIPEDSSKYKRDSFSPFAVTPANEAENQEAASLPIPKEAEMTRHGRQIQVVSENENENEDESLALPEVHEQSNREDTSLEENAPQDLPNGSSISRYEPAAGYHPRPIPRPHNKLWIHLTKHGARADPNRYDEEAQQPLKTRSCLQPCKDWAGKQSVLKLTAAMAIISSIGAAALIVSHVS